MKIVGVDNFDRDTEDDFLVAEHVEGAGAKQVVDFLNKMLSGDTAPRHYVLKPDDYELYTWEP